ncbi:hypothetical protein L7F22_048474 [Adiantum nelumboides]|nr:hypothetical protein [Adiantum nelumboides]
MFREHSKLELRKPSSTRFAYLWLLLERLYDVKLALRQTVVSTMWTEWEESSLDSSKEMQRIIFNEEFWERVRAIVIMITPLYRVLRMTDMEGATLGLLVHFMRAAMDEMKACNLLAPNEKRDVISKVEERWTWMRRPIHGLAALLHPAYKAPELFTDAELLADRDAFLPKALTEEEHGKFLEELIAYNDQRGGPAFASPTTWKREYLVKPLFWWDSFGYGHRSLQKVAMRLLAQDCSSGACERSWSSYSLIHTKIRNRLSTKQLERLVYCRSNMRMLAAMHKLDHAKQVNVDDFKLTGDTLQSVNKEVDVEEERIYAELYQELEEIDRRVSRTRHGRERGEQARTTTSRRGRGRGPRGRGGRRGSGSSSAAYEHEDDPIESSDEDVREPEYDDDGNLLSEPDFPSGSETEASASPMLHDDSDDGSFTLSP